MPSSYTLGAHFEGFVRSLVDSGRYNTASEVLRDGLRLLEDREKLRDIEIAELRQMAEEGRLSGLSEEPGEVFLARLRRKYEAMVEDAERQRA